MQISFKLIVFSRIMLIAWTMFLICTLATKSTFAGLTDGSPSGRRIQTTVPVDPPCGTLGGISIDHMETVGSWQTGTGGGATCGTLMTAPGYSGQAIRLDCSLGTTLGAYGQLRRDFSTLNLSSGDHLRFFYRGTTTNTLEMGVTDPVSGMNYFSSSWNNVTQVPWWTFGTWDYRDFRKSDTDPFPNWGNVGAIFISMVKKKDDVGGIGSLVVDEMQYLKVSNRTVPTNFEFVTIPSTVTAKAADWIAAQQQPSGLLASWPEEYQQDHSKAYAWLYDQAVGSIVLSDTDLTRADRLAASLRGLQNMDGSWYGGYDFVTTAPITISKPVGANAWLVYALMRHYFKNGNRDAHDAARDGVAWLAGLQRPDGSLPGELTTPPDNSAPTEANLDAWWAFNAAGYRTQAANLRAFLMRQAWDDSVGRFLASGNSNLPRGQYEILLDNQTWGAAFLHAIGRDNDARRALSYARWTLATYSNNRTVCGFDGAGPFSVWNEGTLQYVAAHGENSQYYINAIISQQSPDGSLPGSPDEFRGYKVWLTRMHGIAPTAWLYFVGTGGPFHVTEYSFLPLIKK